MMMDIWTPVRSGYINKQSRYLKRWRNRYVEIKDGIITTYKDDSKTTVTRSFTLHRYCDIRVLKFNKRHPYSFVVEEIASDTISNTNPSHVSDSSNRVDRITETNIGIDKFYMTTNPPKQIPLFLSAHTYEDLELWMISIILNIEGELRPEENFCLPSNNMPGAVCRARESVINAYNVRSTVRYTQR